MKHITVLLANVPGALRAVMRVLKAANVDVRAFHLANAGRTGFVQLACDPHEVAYRVLADHFRYYVLETEVLAVTVEDRPGELELLLTVLANAEINISQAYLSPAPTSRATVVIEPQSPEDLPRAAAMLGESGYELVSTLARRKSGG